MVIRYYLQCTHCKKITVLRIALRDREKEPFYFECENCSQSIRGSLVLDRKKSKVKGLEELEGAVQTDIYNAEYMVTYDSHFSSERGDITGLSFSPFLQASRRLPNIIDTMQRLAFLYEIANNMSSDLGRIIRNYKSENWPQFETGVREYIPDDEQVALPTNHDEALYFVIGFSLSPLVTSQSNSKLREFFADYIINLTHTQKPAFKDFLEKTNSLVH